MTHFALISPPFLSHIRAFEALGEALARRGHRVTFILPEGAEHLVSEATIGVVTAGRPASVDLARLLERAGRATGPLGIIRTVHDSARLTDLLCAEAPSILSAIGAEALIGDQMEPAAGLLAASARLPFVSLACALPIDPDPAIPPPFVDWPFDPSAEGIRRNRGAERITRLFLRRQRRTIEEWALRFGLAGFSSLEDCLSPLATIAQTTPSFDYPRSGKRRLHHVGPLRRASENCESLPFRIDPARPLVYASFGTMQGHRLTLFRTIARAVDRLGAQLAIAHCGGLSDAQAASLPAVHVAPDLPQRAVLAKADICITHGGLNTVMDALEFGAPVLAIPIAFDQPGVAARVEHHGAGLKLSRVLLSEKAVLSSLRRLVGEKGFKDRASALGREIRGAGGVDLASDLIEELIGTPWPVPEPNLRRVEPID